MRQLIQERQRALDAFQICWLSTSTCRKNLGEIQINSEPMVWLCCKRALRSWHPISATAPTRVADPEARKGGVVRGDHGDRGGRKMAWSTTHHARDVTSEIFQLMFAPPWVRLWLALLKMEGRDGHSVKGGTDHHISRFCAKPIILRCEVSSPVKVLRSGPDSRVLLKTILVHFYCYCRRVSQSESGGGGRRCCCHGSKRRSIWHRAMEHGCSEKVSGYWRLSMHVYDRLNSGHCCHCLNVQL